MTRPLEENNGAFFLVQLMRQVEDSGFSHCQSNSGGHRLEQEEKLSYHLVPFQSLQRHLSCWKDFKTHTHKLLPGSENQDGQNLSQCMNGRAAEAVSMGAKPQAAMGTMPSFCNQSSISTTVHRKGGIVAFEPRTTCEL